MLSNSQLNPGLIFSLFIPWIMAVLLQGNPELSYWTAWLGSFFIFYQSWFSSSRFILPDFHRYSQIMRPLFLQQLIFSGFMCCTSVFYFIDNAGYLDYLDASVDNAMVQNTIATIAKCQRLSLLAHASLVSGVLLMQQKHLFNRPVFKFTETRSKANWMLWVCAITFILSIIMQRIPGLYQFSIGLYNVAVFSGAVILVKGFREKNIWLFFFGGSLFIANVINSAATGYKEHIIVNFIILVCLLFPYYRKTVTVIAVPSFLILFYILPTYVSIIREQSWGGETSAEDARNDAFETLFSQDDETIEDTNWSFLTHRLSEINMFTEYVSSTPSTIPYYELDIVENSLIALVPRVFWASKPVTESVAMERVYSAGVINPLSNASAKTRPVVDGYLSAGIPGVFIYMLLLGILSQLLNNISENLFGGYETGCIIFFNGFFEVLWRGETMEFMINSIFWSFICMLMVFYVLRSMGYIKKIQR